jgi:leader peptidase (prepilin peptidase)/N-methyltransferase
MLMILITVILLWLGLCVGSFVNAVVWRLHQQSKAKKGKPDKKLSIINGRSMCVRCKHVLAWYDLIPLASWLSLRGKCRYCKKAISSQYPIVELISSLVFAGSYIFWPETLHLNGQWLLLAAWLTASVGLLALAIYDLRWMILPNKIIYPTLAAAVAGRTAYLVLYDARPLHSLVLWVASVAIASGVFFALFMVSSGKWIGYGDVRLGLITGTLLADPQKALAMIFIASLIGSLIAVPSLASGKRTMASKLPYGPFLIVATGLMEVWGESLLNWYKGLLF